MMAAREELEGAVLCKGQNRRQYAFYYVGKDFIDIDDGKTVVMVNDYYGQNAVDVMCHECPFIPEVGVWHQVAAIWDGMTIKVYEDGVKIDEEEAPGVLASNTEKLFIGADPPGSTEYFFGSLDDLAIWNRALTADEVAQLYERGMP